MLLEITNTNLNPTLAAEGLLVLDFWSAWCGPCLKLNPTIKALADKNLDVAFGKVNITENQDIAESFSITHMPTIIFIKNGNVLKKTVGLQSEAQLQKIINELK